MAQVYNSSVSVGAGNTGRAAVESGDAIYLNPGTLPHLRGRHFLSSFAKDELALSLSDNTQDSTIPGGLGYVQTKKTVNNQEIRNHDFAIAIADFVKGSFTVGITAHHTESTFKGTPDTSYRQNNADLGFAYILNEKFGLGAVFYNLMGSRKDVPSIVRLSPEVGLGLNYIYKDFVHYLLDYVSGSEFNMGRPRVMAGLEVFVNPFVIWRVGAETDQNDQTGSQNFVTAGFGFSGPRFSINYAYQGNLKDSKDYRHSIDLQIPF